MMKGEPLKKPPPLLLPPAKIKTNVYSKPNTLKGKGKSLEERAVHKFTAKYDSYHGILKRVSDMKLNGSLDSEEPSTESEKSESSSCRTRSSSCSKHNIYSNCSSYEENFNNGSAYDDESSASSITGSDHCPPYEEIPTVNGVRYRINVRASPRDSFMSLPSPPAYPPPDGIGSFRDTLPPPPSPTTLYVNEPRRLSRQNSSPIEYKNSEVVLRQNSLKLSRPTSLYSNCEENYINTRHYSNSDVNDNCTTPVDNRVPSSGEVGSTEGISETERNQIETFFRGLRTQLYVCNSLANLYNSTKDNEGNWKFKHTGVPVVILESGDTKSRNKRRIQILLAEKGTCFPLWRDTIDNLSSYRKAGAAFHTMYLSSDHRQIVGLSFDSEEESERLFEHIEELTSNPENINISVPGSKKKKKSSPKKKKIVLPNKEQISNPCLFQHVTSVCARDKPVYMSLQTLIDKELLKKSENIS